MTGKTIMPLLSTLAALVIIAHSTQDFDTDYRERELRPRDTDTGTANYEKRWRTMNVEPLQKSNQGYMWQEHNQDETYQRRRPGRKRKRRPEALSTEDMNPQKRHLHQAEVQPSHQEEFRPYIKESYEPNSDVVRSKRRKKTGHRDPGNPPLRAKEENVAVQNHRRKGQKRKQSSVEVWPNLSEFGGYVQYALPDSNEEISDENKQRSNGNTNRDKENYHETYEQGVDYANNDYKSNTEYRTDADLIEVTTQVYQAGVPQIKYENYLSEFAIEKIARISEPEEKDIDAKVAKHQKSDDLENNKSKAMIDPLSLKSILKRSNGRSLSEILQQNNLTLSDLLTGKENALSILKMQDLVENTAKFKIKAVSETPESHRKELSDVQHDNDKLSDDVEQKQRISFNYLNEDLDNINNDTKATSINTQSSYEIENPDIKTNLRERFPVVRRKLRMRPDTNKPHISQLTSDIVALTSTKYQNNRNTSKYRDRRKLLPFNVKVETNDFDIATQYAQENDITPTTLISLSTIPNLGESNDAFTENIFDITNAVNENNERESMNTADTNGSFNTECTSETTTINVENKQVFTEKPKVVRGGRNPFNGSSLRRQAFNNRLKRKRMKQLLSTEEPHDNAMKNIFDMANLVPASEFVAKIKMPTTNIDIPDDYTTLEDFMTTEPTARITKRKHHRKIPITTTPKVTITSDVTAKIEIQEILNDTINSEKLSRILRERNMTLKELVEQRERGSSHIHLADIFHNTSKEPNPPEPFLSKSSIEPISKGTYPLRALLEANQHDPKTTTIDSIVAQSNYLNKPIVMDFRNNVNEHSENIGIVSLFNNFTTKTNESIIQYYETKENDTSVQEIKLNEISVSESLKNESAHDADKIVSQEQDSRTLNSGKNLVTWNEIISFIQENKQNESDRITPKHGNDLPLHVTPSDIKPNLPLQDTLNDIKKIINPEEDSFRIFEDLQHLKENSNKNVKTSSTEEIEVKIYDSTKSPQLLDFYDTVSSNTKSVTVATAGLIGLSLVLFLLTYSIFKWKQQNKIFQNKASKQNEVPSPVFENRKSLKMNSSTRSKSPILSPSNIYTIDSLDTHKGGDSPEYMWDSLRKPFQ